MDHDRFELFTRALSRAGSRRRALGAALSGALGAALGAPSGEATAARKKQKPCPPCKKRKQGKCKAKLPDGTACNGGSCQDGSCVAAVVPSRPDPPAPPPVCTPSCTGGRVCQAGGVCACPSGTRGCFNGNCGECCSNFDCCTPPDGQFTCPPGSQTCLDTIPRVCGYSCTDGVRNGSESDIDCGGSCPRCANGKRCNTHQDCVSAKCGSGRCVECLTTADCQGTQVCADGMCVYGGGTGDGGGGADS